MLPLKSHGKLAMVPRDSHLEKKKKRVVVGLCASCLVLQHLRGEMLKEEEVYESLNSNLGSLGESDQLYSHPANHFKEISILSFFTMDLKQKFHLNKLF